MIKEVIATGATIEEAVQNGCRELGVERYDVCTEVLEYPKSKTFGLFGGSQAKVRVYVESDDEQEIAETVAEIVRPAPEKKQEAAAPVKPEVVEKEAQAAPVQEAAPAQSQGSAQQLRSVDESALGADNPGVIAANYLRNVLSHMKLDGVKVELCMEEGKQNSAVLNLTGSALGSVIGRRGETLAALQYLVSLAANNGDGDYYRVAINIGNYREKREGALEILAKKTAARAVKINKNLALEPMNPYERRIVHTTVQEIDGVSSWSVDKGAKRHVVIGPTGLAEGEDGLPVNFGRGGKPGRGRGAGRSSGRDGYSRSGGYRSGRGGGYRSNRGNRDSYNRGDGNDIKTYPNNYGGQRRSSYSGGSQQSSANSAPRRDTNAPLYGRIEVPKRSNDGE